MHRLLLTVPLPWFCQESSNRARISVQNTFEYQAILWLEGAFTDADQVILKRFRFTYSRKRKVWYTFMTNTSVAYFSEVLCKAGILHITNAETIEPVDLFNPNLLKEHGFK